jgi:hypothetical protein
VNKKHHFGKLALFQCPEKGGPPDEDLGQLGNAPIFTASVESRQDFSPQEFQALDMKIDVRQDPCGPLFDLSMTREEQLQTPGRDQGPDAFKAVNTSPERA